MCTLIGTSTNLVVNGLLIEAKQPAFRMFDLAWIGVPTTAAGLLYLLISAKWLLPERKPAFTQLDDPREYTVEMMVAEGSTLVGRTIEQAGLRHLPGMYLMEIDRDGHVRAAVSSTERLEANDRLVFVGIVESVIDLRKIPGLVPATKQTFKLNSPPSERCLVEAVVSNTCPLVQMTIRESRFRAHYNAAVIAVARNGQRLRKKIGDIELLPGDTLLLETHPSFVELQRNSRDFFLVSRVENSTPPRHDRAWIAQLILLAMIVAAASGLIDILKAAMLAAGLMIATRCLRWTDAKRSVDWGVLLVIGAGLGIGKAMENSGAAVFVAETLLRIGGDQPWTALAVTYGVTLLLTNFITNNAAAVLIFPIALATASNLGVNFMPFAVTVAVAASASFASPIGYQTNLMVYSPGGYRLSDYVRLGGPLSLLTWAITVAIAPFVWPFK
jgi:di/tricarboxylate transporter